jgi:hypothetical protein
MKAISLRIGRVKPDRTAFCMCPPAVAMVNKGDADESYRASGKKGEAGPDALSRELSTFRNVYAPTMKAFPLRSRE